MKISILIPAYNESETIELLVSKIHNINKDFSIIIIDDDSRDGTHEILANIKDKYKVISYIRKNKKGYGSALIYGFQQAKDFDVIITMDADLSHDPSAIPSLINEINNGYEIVIGSRYTEGGKINDWRLLRRITSRLVNILVAVCLQTNIKDNTSGYRAYSRFALNELLCKINSHGYCILEEILYLAKRQNLKCKEVPIIFTDRKRGFSKAKMIKEAIQLVLLIIKLRIRSLSK